MRSLAMTRTERVFRGLAVGALVEDVWCSGQRYRRLETHPLSFPSSMSRSVNFSLGGSKSTMDAGFPDAEAVRDYAVECGERAGSFALVHGGTLIADGEQPVLCPIKSLSCNCVFFSKGCD